MATGTDMSKNILQFDYNYGNNVGDENGFYKMCKLNTPSTESSSEKKSEILQLRFKYSGITRIPDPVYTGKRIGGEDSSIEVVLIDVLTGKVVKSGSEALAEVEILVLDQNKFDKNDDTDIWTAEEFEACILGGRYGKASLLGRTRINLTEGCGSLNDIFFSHTKHPLRNTKVRLGARIVQVIGSCHGAARIREAVSSPFRVKDRRAMNKNHCKLSRTNKVSRLKNIGKDGPSHKNLRREGIEEVGHFLNMYVEDPGKLKNILAKTMSPEKLMITINHAITCEHEQIPLKANHHDEKLKNAEARDMVISAFKNGDEVITFDDEAPFIDFSSGLFTADEYSNTAMLSNSDTSKLLTFHKNERGDYPEPSTYSPDIFSSMYSLGAMTGLDDYGLQSMDSINVTFDQTLDIPGQVANNIMCDTESITQAFCDNEHLHFFDSDYPFQRSILRSPNDLQSAVSSFLVCPVLLDKAQTRWKMLFSVLRWFSIKRIVAGKYKAIKAYC